MDDGDRAHVTLHSSWTGILLASFGAVSLVLLAVVTIASVGLHVASGALGALALAVGLVVLFDLPIASEFHADRVVRRAPLRHETLEWSSLTRLTRARVGVVRTRHGSQTGGLVAVRNRRSYLLVDRGESQQEFDAVVKVMGDWSTTLLDPESLRPPPERTPTWMYRHRRWRTASQERR